MICPQGKLRLIKSAAVIASNRYTNICSFGRLTGRGSGHGANVIAPLRRVWEAGSQPTAIFYD